MNKLSVSLLSFAFIACSSTQVFAGKPTPEPTPTPTPTPNYTTVEQVDSMITEATSPLQSALDAIATRVSTLETQIASLFTWKAETDTKITDLESRPTQSEVSAMIATATSPLQTAIDSLVSRVTTLETQVGDLLSWKVTVDSKLAEIADFVTAAEVDSMIAGTVAALQSSIDSVSARVTTLESRVNSLVIWQGSVDRELLRLGSGMTFLDNVNDQQNTQIMYLNQDIWRLEALIASQSAKLDEYEVRISELEGNYANTL